MLDDSGRLISFLPLQDADKLIREQAEQNEIAANYVKLVDQGVNFSRYNNSNGMIHTPQNGKAFSGRHNATLHNGIDFDNGNGLASSGQGFAVGVQKRLSQMNGYLSELAAAVFVCRVSS